MPLNLHLRQFQNLDPRLTVHLSHVTFSKVGKGSIYLPNIHLTRKIIKTVDGSRKQHPDLGKLWSCWDREHQVLTRQPGGCLVPDLNLLLNKYFISHQTNEVLGFASGAQSAGHWQLVILKSCCWPLSSSF